MTENALNKLIRIDFDPEILENYRIDPSERLQTQEQRQFEPLDVTKIDLADMEKKGIRMEDIEPHLKAMSYGHKSNGLVARVARRAGGRLAARRAALLAGTTRPRRPLPRGAAR